MEEAPIKGQSGQHSPVGLEVLRLTRETVNVMVNGAHQCCSVATLDPGLPTDVGYRTRESWSLKKITNQHQERRKKTNTRRVTCLQPTVKGNTK